MAPSQKENKDKNEQRRRKLILVEVERERVPKIIGRRCKGVNWRGCTAEKIEGMKVDRRSCEGEEDA